MFGRGFDVVCDRVNHTEDTHTGHKEDNRSIYRVASRFLGNLFRHRQSKQRICLVGIRDKDVSDAVTLALP